MGGNPDQRRSDGTEPDLAPRPESDSQLWLPRPGDSRAGTRLARLNSALEPSFFQSVDPPRASADSKLPESVRPRRVVSPWIDDFADIDENAEAGNIVVAMWSDGERQGWFVLSLMLLASLVALIGYSTAHPPARDLFGTVTGDRFASTRMLKPGTSTNASAFEPISQEVSERNTQESPASDDQEAIWRRSLPVALDCGGSAIDDCRDHDLRVGRRPGTCRDSTCVRRPDSCPRGGRVHPCHGDNPDTTRTSWKAHKVGYPLAQTRCLSSGTKRRRSKRTRSDASEAECTVGTAELAPSVNRKPLAELRKKRDAVHSPR